MGIIIGSARIDENGRLSGGKAGDQTGNEVATQSFYIHSKGWIIIRPKSVDVAEKIAELMRIACNNPNLGYDQNNRLGVITYGINSKTPTECDCSSLVRQCVKEATGKDAGDFTTLNEVTALKNTGLFEKEIVFINLDKTPLYSGDILVTKTKGHTVIVTSGQIRKKIFEHNGVDFSPVFDANYYKEKNPDVVKSFGDAPENLFKHFISCGIKEKRKGCESFDKEKYLENNPDLWYLIYIHYCTQGKNENRKTT